MRKIDRFTALYEHVNAQKLSRVFAICMCVMYMSCNACAKTLLSFCVYEQRLCHVFTVYVTAMHVNWSDKAKNRSIYCITQACKCAKVELCLCSICMCDVYELQRVRKDVAVILCIWAKTVSCLYNVYICDACKLIEKSKNQSIYFIASMCMCAKAESCLHNIYMYVVYEFNVWIQRCYCSVCDCAACKLIWKSEKSIDLLHCINVYMRKSWVMPSQYICVCCIWVQRVNTALLLLCVWLRCM